MKLDLKQWKAWGAFATCVRSRRLLLFSVHPGDQELVVRACTSLWRVECASDDCGRLYTPIAMRVPAKAKDGMELQLGDVMCPSCGHFRGILRTKPRPGWRVIGRSPLRLLLSAPVLTFGSWLQFDASAVSALRVALDRWRDGELPPGEVFELPDSPEVTT